MTFRNAAGPFFALALVVVGGCSSKEPPPTTTAASPSALAPSSGPLPSPIPLVAARVNGHELPTRTVAVYALGLMRRKQLGDDKRPEAMRESLERLIDREILLQEALRRGLSADEGSINAAYDQARVNHRGETEWNAFLSDQGTNEIDYRNELRAQKTIETLVRDEMRRSGNVDDAEVLRHFEDHKDQYPTGFEPSKDMIKSRLLRERQARSIEALLASLRAKASIVRSF